MIWPTPQLKTCIYGSWNWVEIPTWCHPAPICLCRLTAFHSLQSRPPPPYPPNPHHSPCMTPLDLCTCFPSTRLPFPHLVAHLSFNTPSRVSFFLEIGGHPATCSSHLFKSLALTMILNLLPASQELLPIHHKSLGKWKPKLYEIPLHIHLKAEENCKGGETWNARWFNHNGKQFGFFKKLNMELPWDSAI